MRKLIISFDVNKILKYLRTINNRKETAIRELYKHQTEFVYNIWMNKMIQKYLTCFRLSRFNNALINDIHILITDLLINVKTSVKKN